jgi:hypothetical protein
VATAFNDAYWALFACTVLAFIPAAFLPRRPREPAVSAPARIPSKRPDQPIAEIEE